MSDNKITFRLRPAKRDFAQDNFYLLFSQTFLLAKDK
jgi:hypothetical protein